MGSLTVSPVTNLVPLTQALETIVSGLPDGDRQALEKLVQAAQIMDSLYLEQEWEGNAELKKKLANAQGSGAELLLRYFNINQV